MNKFFLLLPSALLVCSFAFTAPAYPSQNITLPDSTAITSLPKQLFNQYIEDIYQINGLQATGLDKSVLTKAITGYYNLKVENEVTGNSSIITIIDFAKSSCTKRLWIIDLKKHKMVLNTWVAHGQNSGDDIASHFSNDMESLASSLGFYVTENVYMGKHGRSLKLNGMDAGFNDMANKRDIVIHSANYVCTSSIAQLGRLGRSQGCPAVSPKVVNLVIDKIKGKTVLFINGNDDNYNSKYLDPKMAAHVAFQDNKGLKRVML